MVEVMPVPVLGAIYNQFASIRENFPDSDDAERWAAFSPTCLADCFSNPILFSHFTSDILVPIDQLTKRYTYDKPGETLPEGFKLRMSEFSLPESLRCSMAEALPQSELSEKLYPAPDGNADVVIDFDISKRFNIAVFDEGPVEAVAGHQKNFAIGKNDATEYIEAQFARSSQETSVLTVEKLIMLAERYEGKSVQLPAHVNADENTYGSLAMYQKTVLEELQNYIADCGKSMLCNAIESVVKEKPELAGTLEAIERRLSLA